MTERRVSADKDLLERDLTTSAEEASNNSAGFHFRKHTS